ncbi:MAG: BTAD domain-containing putative transcriptional regulator [Gemmatimonadota bacterium]
MLELKTLGGLRLEADGVACGGAAAGTKNLALLALLVTAAQGVSRDKLIAYLWPETDSAHGRHLLKQACHDLRRELRQPELFLGRKFLQLNPAAITGDAQRFEAAFGQGDLERAVTAYGGPFLDGFYLDGCEEFERWVEAERERRSRQASVALERLAKAASARADHTRAAEWWRRLAELDPLSAKATVSRMTALAAARERAEAMRVGREYTDLVRRELDAAPPRAVAKLMDQLRQQSDEPAMQPAPAPVRQLANLEPRAVEHQAADAPRRARWRRQPVILAAGAVAAAAALVALAIGSGSAQSVIAVSPIHDYSGSDSAALLGPTVTEMLVTNLARAPGVQVISTTRLNEVVDQMAGGGDNRATISRAAVRAGATELLEGTLLRRPDGTLRLELQLVDLRTGIVRRAYVTEDRDPIALVDHVSTQLTETLATPTQH